MSELVPRCGTDNCQLPSALYVRYKRTRHWEFLCLRHYEELKDRVAVVRTTRHPKAQKVIAEILALPPEIRDLDPGRMMHR